MNKKTMISLAMLQTVGLFGADFTAEDIQKCFDEIEPLTFHEPKQLPVYSVLGVTRIHCPKCGKAMQYRCEPGLMKALVSFLNERCEPFQFELDDSRICPHCGDGKLYLKSKGKRYDNETQQLVWESDWSWVKPVCKNDIILLIQRLVDKELVQRENDMVGRSYFDFSPNLDSPYFQPKFIVKTEADFEHSQWKGFTNMPEDLAKWEKEQAAKWQKRGEIFQKLTENASVLRRKDLDGFLKQLNAPEQKRMTQVERMFTRMMIHPDSLWERLTCPACKKPFFVNGYSLLPQGAAHQGPAFGELQAIIGKLDVTPDYSSLCPYCHPDDNPRLLRLNIRLGEKTYCSECTPNDLMNIMKLISGQRLFSMEDISRLRAILQGAEDDSRIAAIAVPENEGKAE